MFCLAEFLPFTPSFPQYPLFSSNPLVTPINLDQRQNFFSCTFLSRYFLDIYKDIDIDGDRDRDIDIDTNKTAFIDFH